MGCMKCGRDLEGDGVFCQSCLETMLRYPVRSDTVVILPQRQENSSPRRFGRRKPKKKNLSQEALAKRQRRRRRLGVILVILGMLLCLGAGFLAGRYVPGQTSVLPGQNYGSIQSQPESTE